MKKFEIVGIGNAIVDVISTCDDSFLDLMGSYLYLPKSIILQTGGLALGEISTKSKPT